MLAGGVVVVGDGDGVDSDDEDCLTFSIGGSGNGAPVGDGVGSRRGSVVPRISITVADEECGEVVARKEEDEEEDAMTPKLNGPCVPALCLSPSLIPRTPMPCVVVGGEEVVNVVGVLGGKVEVEVEELVAVGGDVEVEGVGGSGGWMAGVKSS
ncbi:hypothetical protein HDU97_009052, partial [Phlyctochytrium planicorne]